MTIGLILVFASVLISGASFYAGATRGYTDGWIDSKVWMRKILYAKLEDSFRRQDESPWDTFEQGYVAAVEDIRHSLD